MTLLNAVLAVAAIVIGILLLLIVIKHRDFNIKLTLLESKLKENELLTDELRISASSFQSQIEKKLSGFSAQLMEDQQVSKQLEHRTKILLSDVKQLQQSFENIQLQQPEDKLYSRAVKMVNLGADIDEIVQECDIPRAEAEMLIAIHKKGS